MKSVSLKFGEKNIELPVPDSVEILSSPKVSPLSTPAEAIRHSLDKPIGTKSLSTLARGLDNAVIVVSDNTRPIPYKGSNGILSPVIKTLKNSGVQHIKIIIACGTHHPMEKNEIHDMLGDSILQGNTEIINHIATDNSVLRQIGDTDRTSNVTVNKYYLDAQLKIATGLVEPHFMAGFSGGRKAICPGICGQNVTCGFHSASILNEKGATSLTLEGNPCHEEALRIAKMAGVDFIVNVTIDSEKQITGVFSGDLEKAHIAAVKHLRKYSTIELNKLYDVVVSTVGDVGINHYQCAKAACEASRAVVHGGKVILVGDLKDIDPAGGESYKEILRLSASLGPTKFLRKISSKDWKFVPEQWQVQMWAKAFNRIGDAKNLYICAPQLEYFSGDSVQEVNVAANTLRLKGESDIDFARRMLQETVHRAIEPIDNKKVLILPDGPYAVPILLN